MRRHVAIALALLLGLSACGTSAADRAAQNGSSQGTAATGFPAEVTSCTETLHFDKSPERVLLLSGTDLTILDALDLLDRVVARAGDTGGTERLVPGLADKLASIPTLEAGDTGTGGALVSTESALSVDPDLVIGYDKGADREQLAAAGVPLYSPDAYCPSYQVEHADWSLVDREVEKIAAIFGVGDRVPAVLDDLHQQVASIASASTQATAAALYLTPGSTTVYAYGASSMVQPIFEANGLKNAYDDETTRVFEVSMEDLLKRNPEWIVLLVDNEPHDEINRTLMALNGAPELKAVANQHVVILPFPLTDPPNVLSVRGAVELAKLIEKK